MAPKLAYQPPIALTRCSASNVRNEHRCSRARFCAALAGVGIAALLSTNADAADDLRPELKVSGGSASTSATKEKSVTKTLTRGVNMERADFSGRTFEGVSFQQSILRQADFSNAKLRDASFFDADLSGANFTGADLRGVNVSKRTLRAAWRGAAGKRLDVLTISARNMV